jgi:hypothetical protein
LTLRELQAGLQNIEGLEAQWDAVYQRMPGESRTRKALTAINQCLRIGQQMKAFWDRQQVLTAQIRRYSIAHGLALVREVDMLVTHLQSLAEMAARYRTHQGFADSDEAAFQRLRTWYGLQRYRT